MFYSKKAMRKIYIARCLYLASCFVVVLICTLVFMGMAIVF